MVVNNMPLYRIRAEIIFEANSFWDALNKLTTHINELGNREGEGLIKFTNSSPVFYIDNNESGVIDLTKYFPILED